MPSNTNVLDEARNLVKKRLAELNDERKELESALAELGGKSGGKSSRKSAGRRPGRPRGSAKVAKKPARKRRRRKSSRRGGTRADQAVDLVKANPGISASDIAKRMKIKPNYLYRVLGDLQKEGRLKKKGRAYHAS